LLLLLLYDYYYLCMVLFDLYRPNGNTLAVPKANVLVPDPKIGEVVSFSFENNTYRDVPLNPEVSRVRFDLLWEDAVQNFFRENKALPGITSYKRH